MDRTARGDAAPRPSEDSPSSEVAARAAATRAAIVGAARRLFLEKGFAGTSTEEVVAAAGVGTRGALYHHFADKRALFLVVLEDVQNDMLAAAARAREHVAPKDSLGVLTAGVMAFLDAAMDPEVQRILLIDGRSVLGWKEWRTREEEYGLGALRHLLISAVNDGSLPPQPINALTHIVFAVVEEAALYIANSADPASAKIEAVDAVDRLLSSLARSNGR